MNIRKCWVTDMSDGRGLCSISMRIPKKDFYMSGMDSIHLDKMEFKTEEFGEEVHLMLRLLDDESLYKLHLAIKDYFKETMY